MSILRRSALLIAIVASVNLAWADGDATIVLDEALPEPPGVFIWANVPPEVLVSQLVTVHVLIRNRRQSEPYTLEDLEISDRFFQGFEVDTITPQPYDVEHSQGTLTLNFDLDIAAQLSAEILINLRAVKVGMFSGDVDLWSNDADECATRRLQTEIVAKPDDEQLGEWVTPSAPSENDLPETPAAPAPVL